MSPRRGRNRRSGGERKPKAVEVWRPVPQLPDPEPIQPATDPTAMLESLGDPPLPGQGSNARHYFAYVARDAARMATALAAAAGVLGEPPDEHDA